LLRSEHRDLVPANGDPTRLVDTTSDRAVPITGKKRFDRDDTPAS